MRSETWSIPSTSGVPDQGIRLSCHFHTDEGFSLWFDQGKTDEDGTAVQFEKRQREKIGQLLLKRGVLDQVDIDKVLAEQAKKLSAALAAG